MAIRNQKWTSHKNVPQKKQHEECCKLDWNLRYYSKCGPTWVYRNILRSMQSRFALNCRFFTWLNARLLSINDLIGGNRSDKRLLMWVVNLVLSVNSLTDNSYHFSGVLPKFLVTVFLHLCIEIAATSAYWNQSKR